MPRPPTNSASSPANSATRCSVLSACADGAMVGAGHEPHPYERGLGSPASLARLQVLVQQRGLYVAGGKRWGIRWNCWNTNPMESPRSAERRASSRPATSMPSTLTMPELGRSRQPSSPSVVDFPDPDGPTIDMKSPAWIGGVPRSGLQPRRVLVELHLADPHQRDWLRPLSSAGILVFLADEG